MTMWSRSGLSAKDRNRQAEAASSIWKPDYYRADVSPAKAIEQCGPPRKPWET